MTSQHLALKMVRVRGPQLRPFIESYGDVVYHCERGQPSAIYMKLLRPSHRQRVVAPQDTSDLKITLWHGLPFSKTVAAEFCGPKIDAYIDQIAALEPGNHAGMVRILTPLLKGELSAFSLT